MITIRIGRKVYSYRTIKAAADAWKVDYMTFYMRVKKLGWTPTKAALEVTRFKSVKV